MKRITIGLDIAKSVFPVHGEGSSGKSKFWRFSPGSGRR